MENESRAQQWVSKISEKLNDQAWFQQIKTKWEELDPQSRMYLKLASIVGAFVMLLIIVVGSVINVWRLEKEFSEKSDLLSMIQNANDEMKRLRDSVPSAASGGRPGEQNTAPWSAFFESTATAAGIDKGSLSIAPEKPGTSNDLSKEALVDISVKHANIKQIVRYAFHLENGARPVKLRNLSIDTKNDPTGYMDATLSVSAFSLKQ